MVKSRILEKLGAALLAGSVLVVLCAGPASTPASAAGGDPCLPAGARTLAVDRDARAFSWHGFAYGCLDATGQRRNLGRTGFCNLQPGRAGPVKLAGVLVAEGLERCGVDTGSSTVVVLNLASGRRLADLPAATLVLGAETYVSVQSLVLRSDGAVAWITRDESLVGNHVPVYEIHRFVAGKSDLLGSGTAIDPTSLRLAGSRLTWRAGKVLRSASL